MASIQLHLEELKTVENFVTQFVHASLQKMKEKYDPHYAKQDINPR